MEHATRKAGVGNRIKAFRQSKGLTAAELARRTGITENAIRKIEAGSSKEPRFSTGIRIARALGVEPEAITGESRAELRDEVPNLAVILGQIRRERKELEREGVQHLFVFGSVARGDATPGSDVDIIVDPFPRRRFSLFNLVGVQEILQRAVSRRVDVLTRGSVRGTLFDKNIKRDLVSAF